MDQYSRKAVMIVTGLRYEEDEDVGAHVCKCLNHIMPNAQLTMKDFVAVHRNGKSRGEGFRPPSITVKFLRYWEKDRFFCKRAIDNRKLMYKGVNFHHNICTDLIAMQKQLQSCEEVKFARYEAGGYFTVCMYDGPDDVKFVNRVKTFEQFMDLTKGSADD